VYTAGAIIAHQNRSIGVVRCRRIGNALGLRFRVEFHFVYSSRIAVQRVSADARESRALADGVVQHETPVDCDTEVDEREYEEQEQRGYQSELQ
jgi:hypothetical protein